MIAVSTVTGTTGTRCIVSTACGVCAGGKKWANRNAECWYVGRGST